MRVLTLHPQLPPVPGQRLRMPLHGSGPVTCGTFSHRSTSRPGPPRPIAWASAWPTRVPRRCPGTRACRLPPLILEHSIAICAWLLQGCQFQYKQALMSGPKCQEAVPGCQGPFSSSQEAPPGIQGVSCWLRLAQLLPNTVPTWVHT